MPYFVCIKLFAMRNILCLSIKKSPMPSIGLELADSVGKLLDGDAVFILSLVVKPGHVLRSRYPDREPPPRQLAGRKAISQGLDAMAEIDTAGGVADGHHHHEDTDQFRAEQGIVHHAVHHKAGGERQKNTAEKMRFGRPCHQIHPPPHDLPAHQDHQRERDETAFHQKLEHQIMRMGER